MSNTEIQRTIFVQRMAAGQYRVHLSGTGETDHDFSTLAEADAHALELQAARGGPTAVTIVHAPDAQ